MKYAVKADDTLYCIAKRYGITVFSLIISNPQIKMPSQIKIGQIINIPLASGNIVQTKKPYTYEVLVNNIKKLKKNYPFLNIETIGKSVLGKEIYAISIGRGKKEVFYNGAHHSNEWITVPILMKFVEDFSKSLVRGNNLYDFDTKYIYNNSTVKIVPMVNPDGVNLQINGLTEENKAYHKRLIKWNNNNSDFTYWSANIRGVDINHNYNAAWDVSKSQEPEYEIHGPGPTRYSGAKCESEPETKALVNFTRSNNFNLVIAFHSQGEVIYWDFSNIAPKRSKAIAKKLALISGYDTDGIAPGSASVGGYKDWFIDEFKRSGYTVEVGLGQNPLPLSQFDQIYIKNVGILLLAPLL